MTVNGRKKIINLHAIIFVFYCVNVFTGLIIAFAINNDILKIFMLISSMLSIALAFFHRKARIFLANNDERGERLSVILASFIVLLFPIGTLTSFYMFYFLYGKDDKLKNISNGYSSFKKWLTLIINFIGWGFCLNGFPIFDELFKSLGVSSPVFYIILFFSFAKNIH